jgi:hypothetical protein
MEFWRKPGHSEILQNAPPSYSEVQLRLICAVRLELTSGSFLSVLPTLDIAQVYDIIKSDAYKKLQLFAQVPPISRFELRQCRVRP